MSGFVRAPLIALCILSFAWTQSVLAARPYDWLWFDRGAKVCHGEPDCIPCAGEALVVEEKDPETGATVRVSLGGISAERVDDTIVLKEDGQTILTLEVPQEVIDSGEFVALADSVKTLTDICLLNPKEFEVFESLVYAIVIPELVELGLSYEALALDGGYAGAFVLILVLFILLVIIGAGFGDAD